MDRSWKGRKNQQKLCLLKEKLTKAVAKIFGSPGRERPKIFAAAFGEPCDRVSYGKLPAA